MHSLFNNQLFIAVIRLYSTLTYTDVPSLQDGAVPFHFPSLLQNLFTSPSIRLYPVLQVYSAMDIVSSLLYDTAPFSGGNSSGQLPTGQEKNDM